LPAARCLFSPDGRRPSGMIIVSTTLHGVHMVGGLIGSS
jgi:hypothetical protein